GSVVFCPDYGGNVMYARPLVPLLVEADLRCLGLRLTPAMLEAPGGLDIGALGRTFAADIRQARLPRPLHLVGFSFAGIVAFETARHLTDPAAEPARLWIVDTHIHRLFPLRYLLRGLRGELGYAVRWLLRNRRRLVTGRRDSDVLDHYGQMRFDLSQHPHAYRIVIRRLYEALARYRPKPWGGSATVLRAREDVWPHIPDDLGWARLIRGGLTTIALQTDHLGLLQRSDAVRQVAQIILDRPNSHHETEPV
ncbi:MAG: thioesterase domain-containing protein, partial [Burkholderiaceae bacterium]